MSNDSRITLIQRYRHLTEIVMPALANSTMHAWPVKSDHCFQRIVLDTLCGGVWYEFITSPAHKNLTNEQAAHAVKLCEEIIAGNVDLAELNKQSLIWRASYRAARACKSSINAGAILL